MNERRKNIRFNTTVEVGYTVPVRKQTIIVNTCSKNLSTSGACLLVRDRLEKGAHLGVQLRLPGAELPLELRGIVAWIRKCPERLKEYMAGIEFLKPDELHENLLMSYLYSSWMDKSTMPLTNNR